MPESGRKYTMTFFVSPFSSGSCVTRWRPIRISHLSVNRRIPSRWLKHVSVPSQLMHMAEGNALHSQKKKFAQRASICSLHVLPDGRCDATLCGGECSSLCVLSNIEQHWEISTRRNRPCQLLAGSCRNDYPGFLTRFLHIS